METLSKVIRMGVTVEPLVTRALRLYNQCRVLVTQILEYSVAKAS